MAFRKRNIHAYIATPAYDGRVQTDYALSVAQSVQACTLAGINVTVSCMGNGAFIDLSRNTFAQIFLDEMKDCTHLFFIDADLAFEHRAVTSLLQSGFKVCAGAYRRRQEPEDYPLRWIEHPQVGGLWVENDWIMCDRVATGFLCIERSVIEEMANDAPVVRLKDRPPAPRLFYTKYLDDGRFMGEDYAFCDDYMKRYNEPIRVWPDFDFTHGGYKCNFYNYLVKKIEEKETADGAKGGDEKQTSEAA